MSRRGERLTRVALRLGLLLGGVVAVWGAHELATAGTAYAADRPPAIRAITDSFTPVRTPAPDAEAPSRAPAGSGDGGVAPAQTAGATATAPTGPLPVAAPTNRRPSPATRPERAQWATMPAWTPTAPRAVHHHGHRAVGDAPGPVAGPTGKPVRHAPKPVAQPKPVHAPKPVDRVPHDRPPAAAPTPRAHGVEEPSPGRRVAASPGRGVPAPHSDHALESSSPALSRVAATAASWSRSLPGGPYGPRPPGSDADPTPATPASGTGGASSPGAGHGDSADAGTAAWAPPALAGQRSPRADGEILPSRTPRPGTRPA